jgi:large subunit ribosomal protein L32
MGVPRSKHTKSRRNKGRMHLFIKGPALVPCPKCGEPKRPHTVCEKCGYYKGKEVINVLETLTKKERKKREREMATKEKEERKGRKEKPLSLKELSRK